MRYCRYLVPVPRTGQQETKEKRKKNKKKSASTGFWPVDVAPCPPPTSALPSVFTFSPIPLSSGRPSHRPSVPLKQTKREKELRKRRKEIGFFLVFTLMSLTTRDLDTSFPLFMTASIVSAPLQPSLCSCRGLYSSVRTSLRSFFFSFLSFFLQFVRVRGELRRRISGTTFSAASSYYCFLLPSYNPPSLELSGSSGFGLSSFSSRRR